MSLAFTLHRDTFYDNFHLISTHKPHQITLEHANNYRSKCFDFLGYVEVYFELLILNLNVYFGMKRKRGWNSSLYSHLRFEFKSLEN